MDEISEHVKGIDVWEQKHNDKAIVETLSRKIRPCQGFGHSRNLQRKD
jgi:hypothetical protein